MYIIINPIQGLDCSYVSAITQFIKYYIISEYKRLNDDNEWKDYLPYTKLINLSNCGPVSSHGLYSPKREFRGEASKAVSSYIYKVYVYFLMKKVFEKYFFKYIYIFFSDEKITNSANF